MLECRREGLALGAEVPAEGWHWLALVLECQALAGTGRWSASCRLALAGSLELGTGVQG